MCNYDLYLHQEENNSVNFVDVALHFGLSFESKAVGIRHSAVSSVTGCAGSRQQN